MLPTTVAMMIREQHTVMRAACHGAYLDPPRPAAAVSGYPLSEAVVSDSPTLYHGAAGVFTDVEITDMATATAAEGRVAETKWAGFATRWAWLGWA